MFDRKKSVTDDFWLEPYSGAAIRYFDVTSWDDNDAMVQIINRRSVWRDLWVTFSPKLPAFILRRFTRTATLLVGCGTELRSDPELMHHAVSSGAGPPLLSEEGEILAQEMGASRYMECLAGNKDHLELVLREVRCLIPL